MFRVRLAPTCARRFSRMVSRRERIGFFGTFSSFSGGCPDCPDCQVYQDLRSVFNCNAQQLCGTCVLDVMEALPSFICGVVAIDETVCSRVTTTSLTPAQGT